MRYTAVMGLEIHAELLTETKVFCGCENAFAGEMNSRVCPVCMGMPGALPTLNKEAVTLAARAGFATDCTVNTYSAFDRKNYFYPDLPKSYQITQAEYPICTNGFIEVPKKIRINRIHIEEDAGKLIHDDEKGISLADYNRCGVPLIEIVTEPDFRTVEEVQSFVEQIALRLRYADVCDGKMEQGSLRVDVNISMMPEGADVFGTRAEIKNLNSLRAIRRAIEYEMQRQSRILSEGGRVIQETRRFDESDGKTYPLRSKEEAHDYRYFPEPDIPPVVIDEQTLEKIRASMPELPHKRLKRYTDVYGLPVDDAMLIIADRSLSDFYDAAAEHYSGYKSMSNLILVELLRHTDKAENLKFTPQQFAVLVRMSDDGVVSRNAAKDILRIMLTDGGEPMDIAKNNGFVMENDTDALKKTIDAVLSEHEEHVRDYRSGNKKLFGFLMGQVMFALGSGANPKLARELLAKKLDDGKD